MGGFGARARQIATERLILLGGRGRVAAAITQQLGDRVLTPAQGDPQCGHAVLVGRVDGGAGVEQRRHCPSRASAPHRLVEMSRVGARTVRAEHVDHLRVGEIQCPREVVVDEVLARPGLDHQPRACRVEELAGAGVS